MGIKGTGAVADMGVAGVTGAANMTVDAGKKAATVIQASGRRMFGKKKIEAAFGLNL